MKRRLPYREGDEIAVPQPGGEVASLPQDGLAGHIYLEQVLARRLGVPMRMREAKD